MKATLRNTIKYALPAGVFLFVLAAAAFVFSTRSEIADAGQTVDEGATDRTRDEEAFVLAKNTGNKYVYDPETGKWVLLSDAGKALESEQPAETQEPGGESGAEASIAEYLEKAKRAFAENDLKAARKYADKVIELEDKNRQAQFLLAKIDEAEKPVKTDGMSLKMEETREKAKEMIALKKNGVAAKAASEAKEEEKPLTASEEKVTFAVPRKITAEEIKRPDADISVSMEEARLKIEQAKEEEERKKAEEERIAAEKKVQEEARIAAGKKAMEEEEAAKQKQQLVSAYLSQGENSLLSGDFEDSRDYARNALEIIPESDEARDLMARVDTAEDEYIAELKRERDEQVKQEEDRITAEEKAEDERIKAEEESTRIAAEDQRKEEETRIAVEEKAQEEAQLKEEDRRRKEEEERLAAEERAQEELRIRAEEYAAKIEAEEASLKGEEERLAAEKKAMEEEVTAAEEKAQEEARIAEAEYREEQRIKEEALAAGIQAVPAAKPTMAQRYMDKARENLEKENFNKARKYAVKAVETGEEGELSRDLLAEIDSAEGVYREQHGIIPAISTAKTERSADDDLRRQLRL